MRQNNRFLFLILFSITLVGALLRLRGLTTLSITHIEMYVPGLELDNGLSLPGPRYTVKQIFWSMMEEVEPHPPGYYFFMFIWTKLLNAEIFTIRFPSFLFGVICILLIFILGYLGEAKWAGLWAAGMLALNGYHILWSQMAKMYMMGCFLGLLSSILLILLMKNNAWLKGRLLGFLYLTVVLSGLATTVWVWPIFITQILWVFIKTCREKRFSGLLRLQILILILATPLISLAIFQSRRTSYAGEEGGILQGLGQFLQVGFLFLREFLPGPSRWFNTLATFLLAPLSIFLLAFGLISDIKGGKKSDFPPTVMMGPSSLHLLIAVVCVIPVILGFAKYANYYDAGYAQLVNASTAIPILIFIASFLIDNLWLKIQSPVHSLDERFSLTRVSISITTMLALIPVIIIVVISPFIFLFASRGVLLYVPYLILMMSKGLLELALRTRYWLILGVILAVIHPLSIYYVQYSYHESETDFKSLAEAWIPKIEDSDIIFIRKHPLETPILFYLKPHEYNFVAENYTEAAIKNPTSRIWVLSGTYFPAPREVDEALAGYKKTETIQTRWVETNLYVRQ